jgi:NAD(P)-dependent dehydrogenase (short-subunit alcohol dehydrogenase family)
MTDSLPQPFAGKAALVTGSSSGIGRGCAIALAEYGADIVVNYRMNHDGGEETAALVRALGRRAITVQADVGDVDAVDAMFTRLTEEFGRLDILVNNAGFGRGGLLHELPIVDWDVVIKGNLSGAFFCAQRATRMMLARNEGCRIINITSVHEEAPGVGGGSYHIVKGALRNLTRALALELGPHGITVNTVAPGMILTEMNHRALVDKEYLDYAEALIPVRRAGVPADIAAMVRFLCTDEASYCSGQTHFVDGGWMLKWPPV